MAESKYTFGRDLGGNSSINPAKGFLSTLYPRDALVPSSPSIYLLELLSSAADKVR